MPNDFWTTFTCFNFFKYQTSSSKQSYFDSGLTRMSATTRFANASLRQSRRVDWQGPTSRCSGALSCSSLQHRRLASVYKRQQQHSVWVPIAGISSSLLHVEAIFRVFLMMHLPLNVCPSQVGPRMTGNRSWPTPAIDHISPSKMKFCVALIPIFLAVAFAKDATPKYKTSKLMVHVSLRLG